MSPYHNNQLSMVGLYDTEIAFTPVDQSPTMPWQSNNKDSSKAKASNNGYLHPYESTPNFNYDFLGDSFHSSRYNTDASGSTFQKREACNQVKSEEVPSLVSYTPTYDSDYVESDGEYGRPSKMPKTNKDGLPRKPRQPRPKLLKWSDNDWKNVVLGIIWACGEAGVQIPFDQAAQVVDVTCTASALQQAILKLRGKQISEGHQIPALKMAWTRKNRNRRSSLPTADTKTTQDLTPAKTLIKKRTLQKGNNSLIITLKNASKKLHCKKPEPPKMPVEDRYLGVSCYLSLSPISRPPGQAQRYDVHLPQKRLSKSYNEELLTFKEMMKEPADTYSVTEDQTQEAHQKVKEPVQKYKETPDLTQKRKDQNRRYSIINETLVDPEHHIMGTAEELHSFEGFNTLEDDPFVDGNLVSMSSQVHSIFDDPYGPASGYGQGYAHVLQQKGFSYLPGYRDYYAFTEDDESHELLEDIFKDETPVAQPFNKGFYT